MPLNRPKVGEAVAMSRLPLRRLLKAVAVDFVRLSYLPVHQEGRQISSFPMKKYLLYIIPMALCSSSGLAAEQQAPDTEPTTARVIGDLQDGTPPDPEPPKPAFIVPPEDILETTVHEQDGRKIIVQEIQPIALPAATVEPPTVDQASPSFQDHIAQMGENSPRTELLRLGVTIYHAKDSPPCTLVSYAQGGDEPAVTFWSTANFSLLSGFTSFIGSDGKTRSLMMLWSAVDIDRTAALMARTGRPYQAPTIPELPEGNATFVITSENPSPQALASIQAIHDLYNNEHDRLQTAYQGRQQANLEREAELKAHPPKPRNIVINYWDIHGDNQAEGGSK